MKDLPFSLYIVSSPSPRQALFIVKIDPPHRSVMHCSSPHACTKKLNETFSIIYCAGVHVVAVTFGILNNSLVKISGCCSHELAKQSYNIS